jgi:hypothetical protein
MSEGALKSCRASALLWSASVAIAAGWFVSVEWSHPYCQHQSDGPGYAAYGVPLPFVEYSGASSLHYIFMPHVYALNTLVLSVLAYPLVRVLVRRAVRGPIAYRVNTVASWAAVALIIAASGWFAATCFHPVRSLASRWDSYWSYRPVGITTDVLRYSCSPSAFWFGEPQ